MSDGAGGGTLVVRGGVVVYASEGMAALVGRAALDLLDPEDRARLEDVRARRLRGEVVPWSLELSLVLPGAGRRSVEWHVERGGPEDVVHLRDPGEETARRELLEALAEIGARLRVEPGEDGVYARVRKDLGALGAVSALLRAEAGRSRIVWVTAPEALRREFTAGAGAPPEGFAGPMSAFARRIVEEGAAFTDDWAAYAATYMPPTFAADARSLVQRAGFGRSIGVRIDAPGEEGLYLVLASPLLRSADVPAVRLFGAQVSAAIAAARTIADLSRRNAHLAVLARVAELAGEATDLSAFLAAASEAVRPVAGYAGGAIYVPDEAAGDLVRIHLDVGAPPAVEVATRRSPPVGPVAEALRSRAPRVLPLPYPGADPALMAALPFRFNAFVPLVARSRGVGVLVACFAADEEVVRGSLELLSAVGAYYASAIESHGLLGALRGRLEALEAVHAFAVRVLANAPGDFGALLEDACRELARALSAEAAAVFLIEDGTTLRRRASVGLPREIETGVAELAIEGLSAELIRSKIPLQTPDVTGDRASQLFGRTDLPSLAILGVPLISRRDVRGIVFAAGRVGRRFGPGDVALANAMAAALGVGLENADLWSETARRVEELSLLAEAGRDIAASLDLGDVLRAASEAARRLAGASRAWVLLHDPATGELRVAGGAGIEPRVDGAAVEVEPGTFLDDLRRTRLPVAIDDTASSPVAPRHPLLAGRALAAVPVLLRGALLGVLVADEPAGARRFGASDLGRLGALADRLAVAIENARLYLEARDRAEQLGLIHEVGRSLVETLDIEQVLDQGVRNLARIVGASDAYLCLVSEDGASLVFRTMTRHHGQVRGLVLPARPAAHNLAARVLASREPLLVPDATRDPRPPPELIAICGAHACLALPLVVRDRAIGVVIIVDTRGPRLFTPAEVERASGIANQLAVAADNARLYEDLRRSYAQLARAQQRLVQGERLAALGELSAVVAHEVRNPLGVIFNSLGSLRRLVRPAGDAKMLFDIVEEEAERLNRIVGDLLDFARPSTPEVRPEPLGRVAEDALAAVVLPQAAAIEIVHELDPNLPAVPIDARLVRQAVLNLAVNAVQAMPRGGRITLRTAREGDVAVMEIEDTGAGIPDEVRERIFEPFFTTKASGTGLGLAVVRRIVEGHGGGVRVSSVPGAGTTFALRFPLERLP